MAFLKKNSGLGCNFSGTVGTVVYRQTKEGVVVASLPRSYNTSQSEAAVSDRNRFRLVSASVAGINKIHVYRSIWIGSNVKGRSISNKIQCVNKPRMRVNPDLSNLVLVPAEDNFKVELESFTIEYPYASSAFAVTIKPLSTAGLTIDSIETISLQGLVCCSEPEPDATDLKLFFFAPLLPSVKPLDLNSSLEFRLPFKGADLIQSERYHKKSLLLNLITFNDNLEPFEASENIHIILD